MCLGTYDRADDVVRVIAPEDLSGATAAEPPYSLFPPDVLLEALIAHELAHAILEQSGEGRELALVDHEYVAGVMEIETLDPQWREVYIAAAPVALPPKVGLISAMIYGFAPRKFAVNAWQFFQSEPDGCDGIRRIAEGSHTFASLPR